MGLISTITRLAGAIVCMTDEHSWYYSDYKGLKSRRGCLRCYKRETPQDSREFRDKIIAIEQRAMDDLLEFKRKLGSGAPFDEAFESVERTYPDEWGPLAENLPNL